MVTLRRAARVCIVLTGCGLLGIGMPQPLRADVQVLVPGAYRTILARSGDPLDGGGELRTAFDRIFRFSTGLNQNTFFLSHELPHPNGGLCRLLYNNGTITERRDWITGSHLNCSGSITSWGTILSCEEFPPDEADSLGFVIEVSPDQPDTWVRRGLLGRFSHEMVVEDPLTGDLYLTDDTETGVLFRFDPSHPTSLMGGILYAYRENPRSWIQITDHQHAEQQARALGATAYPRLEGIVYHPIDDCFYISVTGIEKEPNNALGYILRFNPRNLHMTRWLDGNGTQFANPDNIEVDICGNLIVQEDMYSKHMQEFGHNRVVLIRPDRTIMPILRGLDDEGEPTGLVLDPGQRRFWVNWMSGATGSEFIEVNLPLGWNCSGIGVPEVAPVEPRPKLFASPNPFSSETWLVGKVAPGHVRLDIFDARGAHWRTLVDGWFAGGSLEVAWDGRDREHRQAPRGIYFARLRAGDYSASTRIVLAR